MVRCDGNGHHAVVCEVKEGEEVDKEEPEEFFYFPLEAHHSIHYQCIISGLNKHIWYFNNDLHVIQIVYLSQMTIFYITKNSDL